MLTDKWNPVELKTTYARLSSNSPKTTGDRMARYTPKHIQNIWEILLNQIWWRWNGNWYIALAHKHPRARARQTKQSARARSAVTYLTEWHQHEIRCFIRNININRAIGKFSLAQTISNRWLPGSGWRCPLGSIDCWWCTPLCFVCSLISAT